MACHLIDTKLLSKPTIATMISSRLDSKEQKLVIFES